MCLAVYLHLLVKDAHKCDSHTYATLRTAYRNSKNTIQTLEIRTDLI